MKIIMLSDQSKSAEIFGTLQILTSKERLKIAAKKFLLFFALAVVSIFVPVLHFVLVPTFLLIAVIMGIREYSIKYKLENGNGTKCPGCTAPLKEKYFLETSLQIKCDACFERFDVEI